VSIVILPPGQSVKTGIDLAGLDFSGLLQELARKAFTGYLAVMVKGTGGLEEGTLIYDSGKVIACTYEYLRHDKLMFGSDAFPRIANATAAKKGVVDLFQLSADQVKLITAFNDKMAFSPKESDMAAFQATDFSPFYEEQVKEPAAPEAREQLLKRLKLWEAEGKAEEELPAAADAQQDNQEIDKMLSDSK
jgi:hypothetical protein